MAVRCCKSDEKAAQWFGLAAARGNALSQSNLGLMYDRGRGVAQNDQEAVKWYRLSAAQGEASGQFNLGVMYEDARLNKAIRKPSSGIGLPPQNLLDAVQPGADVCQRPRGGAKRSEAAKWFGIRPPGARLRPANLAVMYAGRGVPLDEEQPTAGPGRGTRQCDGPGQPRHDV
jgi:TPR repeat protein